MLVQKICSKDEFFLESLYDPELVALVFQSKVDLCYYRAEVTQRRPAGPFIEGRAV
jgi:hypothetical protein